MRLRSRTSLSAKATFLIKETALIFIFLVFLVFIFNVFSGLLKQVISQKKVVYFLEQKKTELEDLEKKNRNLKKRLEQVQDAQFVQNEARRLLGISSSGQPIPTEFGNEVEEENYQKEEIVPNYKKWLRLFWK